MEKKIQRLTDSHHSPTSMSRLNELPDDILVLILSNLTMKEAARTSVLSHRWQHLWEYIWVYNDASLNFDPVDAAAVNIRPSDYELKTHLLLRTSIRSKRPMVISWVNRILDLHRSPSVNEFRVCYDLDENNGDDIERWIKFAIEKSVCKFELNFSLLNGYYIYCSDRNYRFPSKLLESPNTSLSRPFESLTSLRLICVNLCDEVAASFISNCHSLEHLSIKGSLSLTYLNATTALKLKHLEIEYCHNLKEVDISNTNIESVNFHGQWITRPFPRDLHLLSEVSLHSDWCISTVRDKFFVLPVSQLQRLKLDMGNWVRDRMMLFPKEFPILSNLKHLEVIVGADHDQNIFCLSSLICAAPVLNSFTLKVVYSKPSKLKYIYELPNCEWRKSEKQTHKCLKVVEFYGWHGYNSDMDIVYYLTEISTVLEKVIINPKLHSFDKRPGEYIERISRESAKVLQKHVRPEIEFVIL